MPILTDTPALFQVHRKHRAGRYYGCTAFSTSTSGVFGQGIMYLTPFWCPEAGLYDRIAFELTLAGEAGSVVRMGAYEAHLDRAVPLNKLPFLDAGTVLADGAAGMYEITISQVFPKGLSWLTAVSQNCPTTGPSLRYALPANSSVPMEGSSGGFPGGSGSWRATGVTGALPVQPTVFTGVGSVAPRMWMRRA